ncbi:MAG TPA: alpha/beta hydrolase-fold protein [Candidatus Micrarchaeaceae archaeon]|nr:alpha/beta hydrolase-fold protein [Candidatus Micrarchaeaceae archaeon]
MISPQGPVGRIELSAPPGGPWAWPMRGELVELVLHSDLLRGNHLGDPADRPLWVYLPPAYAEESEQRFPVVYLLQGFSGQVDMWGSRTGFRRTAIELFDELFSDPATPPCLLVFADCWTSLGGSQFLNSPGTGQYHSYFCEEVVPAIDATFRTRADRDHRAVAGHSSGGYGALVSALLRPDLFGALASHAGDALFEFCYLPEFPEAVRQLRDHYQGSYANFWADFHRRPPVSRPQDRVLVELWCMAACYSARADGTPELPFDPITGILRPGVWQRWLDLDPVRLIAARPEAVQSLRAVYLEGGLSDEWYLEVCAGGVAATMREHGVSNLRLELFEGGHRGIEFRYPISIRYLAESMSR